MSERPALLLVLRSPPAVLEGIALVEIANGLRERYAIPRFFLINEAVRLAAAGDPRWQAAREGIRDAARASGAGLLVCGQWARELLGECPLAEGFTLSGTMELAVAAAGARQILEL
ncbi:MAG: hypothetical protein K6A65_08805 [Succinivibrionaceae bacterium]|nr:hypothetical protein [Succinivibrionaceae bacterium]